MPKHSFTTVECTVQNRLGALDRVLGAFTHRGLVPERFVSEELSNGDRLRIAVTVQALETVQLEKLLKSLQKQVYVLDARQAEAAVPHLRGLTYVPTPSEDDVAYRVAELYTPDFTPKRKVSHVHNA